MFLPNLVSFNSILIDKLRKQKLANLLREINEVKYNLITSKSFYINVRQITKIQIIISPIAKHKAANKTYIPISKDDKSSRRGLDLGLADLEVKPNPDCAESRNGISAMIVFL